jgi:hypothetical protein
MAICANIIDRFSYLWHCQTQIFTLQREVLANLGFCKILHNNAFVSLENARSEYIEMVYCRDWKSLEIICKFYSPAIYKSHPIGQL